MTGNPAEQYYIVCSRRGAKPEATRRYIQCPPAARLTSFLQKFKQRPCVLYAWPKQGDCLSQESYVVLDSLISSAPCFLEAGFLKSQMEDQLQCGSPTYPIALYWPPAQQSTEQKILSYKPYCSSALLVRQSQRLLEQPQVCALAV